MHEYELFMEVSGRHVENGQHFQHLPELG